MKFVPSTISRKVAEAVLRGEKHSPTILLGVGVASMVGSTVLACRATLKSEEILDQMNNDLQIPEAARELHPEEFSEADRKKDVAIIYTRGVVSFVKLYGPAIILGGVGIACLTKSHSILQDRNTALAAAYVAVDKAFQSYRGRVVERYGEEADREFRHGSETVDIVDGETGEIVAVTRAPVGMPSGYARWFDEENLNWSRPPNDEHNWFFLRTQQQWANDMLHSRGHMFLNEVYRMCGLPHTSAGAIVGWIYDRDNEHGDNFIDFGCWGMNDDQPLDFYNGRDGGILLDFNVDGPIWHLMDERKDLPE